MRAPVSFLRQSGVYLPIITSVFLLAEWSLNQEAPCEPCITTGKWDFVLPGKHRLFFFSERAFQRKLLHTAQDKIFFPLCWNVSRAEKLHLGCGKKGEITTWGCLQFCKGTKAPGEASWSMLPACIECFKTWCFSFQKQWAHWYYNPLFFWVELIHSSLWRTLFSTEMAFGCGYCDKQRRIGMWCASINMQPGSAEKNIYKN